MKKVWKKTCAAVCSAAMALSATSVAFAAEDAEQELRMQYGNALEDVYKRQDYKSRRLWI